MFKYIQEHVIGIHLISFWRTVRTGKGDTKTLGRHRVVGGDARGFDSGSLGNLDWRPVRYKGNPHIVIHDDLVHLYVVCLSKRDEIGHVL